MDVMVELREVGEMYKSGDFTNGLKKTREIWERVPEPKNATANAYIILEYAVGFALKLRDPDEAWKWACLAPSFIEKRQDLGEVEFLIGRVAFERGDMETAKANFLIAKRKSRGRIFEGQDPKYKALIARGIPNRVQ